MWSEHPVRLNKKVVERSRTTEVNKKMEASTASAVRFAQLPIFCFSNLCQFCKLTYRTINKLLSLAASKYSP